MCVDDQYVSNNVEGQTTIAVLYRKDVVGLTYEKFNITKVKSNIITRKGPKKILFSDSEV